MPLATNEPMASASSTNPVCRASYSSTFCSQSGSERLIPNSPSDTISAAILPLRNDGMRNNEKDSRVDRPRRWRRSPHPMKAAPETTVTRKATGMIESVNGQVHSPRVGAVSVNHHP